MKEVTSMMGLQRRIGAKFPQLVMLKTKMVGHKHARSGIRSSYSQSGEDLIIEDLLKGFDLSKAIYVDVGANQPTRLSNTYLMYRKGMRGVAIEPNYTLCKFFRKIRPRDIVVSSGVGEKDSLKTFYYASAHSSGSFKDDEVQLSRRNIRVIGCELLPVFTLDTIMEQIEYEWICFMSVDTEGMEYEVLQGAKSTLGKTYLLCIETNDMKLFESEMLPLIGGSFEIVKEIGHNHILRNIKEFAHWKWRREPVPNSVGSG